MNAKDYRHSIAEAKHSGKTINGKEYALGLHRTQSENEVWYGYALDADSHQLVAEALGDSESDLRQNLAEAIRGD